MEPGQGYGHSYLQQQQQQQQQQQGGQQVSSGGTAGPQQQYAPPPPPPPAPSFPYHGAPYPPFGAPARSTPGVPSPQSLQPQVPGAVGLGVGLGFFNPWDPPPAPAQPPPDSDLQKRIEKLVEYAVKNGPQFEALMKDKQKENPAYAFLFGAEGHEYYRHKLWLTINHLNPPPPLVPTLNPALATLNAAGNAPLNQAPHAPPPMDHSLNSSLGPAAMKPSMSAPLAAAAGHSGAFPPPYFDPQHHPQPFYDQFQHEGYGNVNFVPFTGPPGSLPQEIALELKGVMDNLTGTKESIKGAKLWFMQRAAFGPMLAEALKDRVLATDDVERQLHVIYLANDILFNSLQHRSNPKDLDQEALAFRPVLGSMLAAIYHNPQNAEVTQDRLQKILHFWGAKEVFDTDTINTLEGEMVAGPPPPEPPSLKPPPAGLFQYGSQWQPERAPQPIVDPQQQIEQSQPSFAGAPPFFSSGVPFNPSNPAQQFLANSLPSLYPSLAGPPFLAPIPAPALPAATPPLAQLPTVTRTVAEHSPYPLFPPGLIPGMVRKMQIGSGVPYSALSPLDIPTAIPPSTLSGSYILERVAKFYKEIGEVDPLEGQVTASDSIANDEDNDEEGGGLGREGGARIPPPGHMQTDPETGTLPDGSLEHRPGAASTGRLGLGAVADPNEVTQYDDVYTSYRKQRSTNYHTSLSARAAAR